MVSQDVAQLGIEPRLTWASKKPVIGFRRHGGLALAGLEGGWWLVRGGSGQRRERPWGEWVRATRVTVGFHPSILLSQWVFAVRRGAQAVRARHRRRQQARPPGETGSHRGTARSGVSIRTTP